MLVFLQTYSKETAAITAVVLAFLLNRVFRLRPRIIYGVRHSFDHLVDQPRLNDSGQQIQAKQIVPTASVIMNNIGLQTAKNVELTFNFRPQFWNVWPARHFIETQSPQDRFTLSFESLAPKETVGIEIFAINAELPIITAVRCDECSGKFVQMQTQKKPATWLVVAVLFFGALGIATAAYIAAGWVEALYAISKK